MRIALLVHSLETGGAERVATLLTSQWVKAGHQVTLITLDLASSDEYMPDPRVERIAIGLAKRSASPLVKIAQNLRRLLHLRRALRAAAPNLVVAFMPVASMLLAIARTGLDNVALGSERVHPPMVPLSALRSRARSLLYARLNGVVAQTDASAQWLRHHTWARHVQVIPNPVIWPLEEHEPRLEPANVQTANRRMVLAAGRLVEQKQFDHLIDAFASLAHERPEWDLVILGEGQLREVLQGEIRRRKMEGRVFLPGRVGNVATWHRAASLFVMSSAFEGFPNALAEAMASGLAVVSYDCPTGPSDLIRHGIDGLLISLNDRHALANAMRTLTGDSDLRARLGTRATEVRERFRIDAVAQCWISLAQHLSKARRDA